jgi:hypothetical protein
LLRARCVLWWMHGDDGAYYAVVDVDSSQFIAQLSTRWKKLEVHGILLMVKCLFSPFLCRVLWKI